MKKDLEIQIFNYNMLNIIIENINMVIDNRYLKCFVDFGIVKQGKTCDFGKFIMAWVKIDLQSLLNLNKKIKQLLVEKKFPEMFIGQILPCK